MINKETKIYDRRIILIDSIQNVEKESENKKKINRGLIIAEIGAGLLTGPVVAVINGAVLRGTKYLLDIKNGDKNVSIGFGEIDYCYDNFRFAAQHPQKGIVYSCSDYESDYYIPLSDFHKHSFKLKESAFIEMCAHLGAKEIILVEEVIDNTKTELNIDAKGMDKVNGKFGAEYNSNYENKSKIKITFPKPENLNKTEYKSKWLDTEPTWKTLQKVRLENNAEHFNAEFSYKDDMGINSNLALELGSKGLNIGGSFNEMQRVERKYIVDFWN